MTLIKSISGIRGTIGGPVGDNLTPIDVVQCTAAFGSFLKSKYERVKVVIGRDARLSGPIVQQLATNTLVSLGIEVIDCALSTTPTVEVAVPYHNAQGGIILTASHNPKQWNALKLLNEKGEFISAQDGRDLLRIIEENSFDFSSVDDLGQVRGDGSAISRHIDQILNLPYIPTAQIQEKNYRVLVDCINSTGAISIVPLLERLNCEVSVINGEMNGEFAHTPEPIPKNLTDTLAFAKENHFDVGIVVDPDVDRIAFIDENGEFLGEEYSLVSIADYFLSKEKSPAVSNLSSSIALQDVCTKHNVAYHSSAVGEVNVVEKMKEVGARIGGEGNGGIILPDLHYGRDALAGAALFLAFMAESGMTASEIRGQYTNYFMIKDKIGVEGIRLDELLHDLEAEFEQYKKDNIDGLKIYFDEGWVHLRKSNTEPIVRIYSESDSMTKAQELVDRIKSRIEDKI